jgi:hypothetical protein
MKKKEGDRLVTGLCVWMLNRENDVIHLLIRRF